MIIECPQCGFTGRVPHRATLVPHQARCPKCGCRFDIGDPDVQIPEAADRAGPDPGDSSYELDPIAVGLDGVWDGPWEDGDDESAVGGATPVRATPRRRPPDWASRLLRPSVLRIRMFQAWAVFFLAWAAYIFMRTTIAAIRLDDAEFLSNDLLRPVAAVVVLVSAAALLCLSVDVSRRLARLTYAPPPTSSAPSANGASPPHHRSGGDLALRPDGRRD